MARKYIFAHVIFWNLILIAGWLAAASYPQAHHYPRGHQHPSRMQDGRCPDGRFHIDCEDEQPQPDKCDNGFKNEHPCHCDRERKACNDQKLPGDEPGPMCQTNCRKRACGCVSMCTS